MTHVQLPRGGIRGAVCTLFFITIAGVPGCQRQDDDIQMPPAISIDEDALPSPEELVGRMSQFMRTHDTFAFDALATYEAVQESGQKLQFDLVHRMAVGRPNRLHWVTLLDDGSTSTVWFADGVFTMLKQPDNIYGQVDGLGTIPEMIDVVVNEFGIVVPFSDLLLGGGESVFLWDLESSLYGGLAWVEGAWTHHVALRNQLVDFQLWIRADGGPVLQKLAITWKHEEGLPSYVARFREWKFSPSYDESQFQFVAPPNAERIDVIPVSPADEVGY